MNEFTKTIVEWYEENKRELPWRESADPYLIWISEIILQQTRVAQGYDYFLRFIKRFPDVRTLAAAEEDEVMKYWQGLGYYSRARNLHAAAKSMNGVFPKTYPEAVEKSPQAREFAKLHFDLDVKPESALKEFAPGSFDVITLWHVMEHLEHLNETWEMLRELLTEKGMLIVAVPNCSSYDAGRYGEYWAAYDVPRHLWHFTPVTIQQLASRHGFIMAARHPMPFDAFYVSMLSEKHRGSSCSFLKGMYVGTLAWFSTLGRKERSSSMIYVFRKKR